MRLAVGSPRRRWVAMWVATLLVSVVGSFLPRAARSADGVWTQIPPPDWKLGASAVYDRTHHRMILFGGDNGLQDRNDTWVLELSYPNRWRRLAPTGTPPPPRRFHNAVYDPIQDRMIVFGGLFYDGTLTAYNDVWALEQLGGTPHWTQLTPTGTPPQARTGSVSVFDIKRNRMLMYGGATPNGGPIGDLWALDLSGPPAWISLAPITGIGPRIYSTAVIDSARDRMVVMGGTVDGITSLNDAWEFGLAPGGIWNQIATLGTPPSTAAATSAYDPLHDQMIVFGGFDAGAQTYLQSGWRLRFSLATPTWSRLPLTGSVPPTVANASGIYDPIADAFRVFGGWGEHPSTVSQQVYTLWLHPSPNWGEPLPSGAPPATGRQGAAVAYDAQNHRMIMFGGQRSWSPIGPENLNDVWMLDLTTALPVWTQLFPTGTPPTGRSMASLVYDPSGNRVVLFGGETDQGDRYQEVWSLSLTGTPAWSAITPTGTPPAGRSRHGAIYDPIRDRMVIFGGSSLIAPYYQGDAFALSLGASPAWTPLSPTGKTPTRRQGMSVVLDSARDRMLMFGGLSDLAPGLCGDVWALNLSGSTSWDSLAIAAGPTGRWEQIAAYDPARDRLVMFGGLANTGGSPIPNGDMWALSLAGSPAWTQLQPSNPPDPDAVGSAVWDVAGDRWIKYGGQGGQNGTWIYQPAAVLAVTPIGPPGSNPAMRATPNPSRTGFDLSFVMSATGRAQVGIYDVTGRRVANLVDATLPAGTHGGHWDGSVAGRTAAPGVYFARFEHAGGVATLRLLLIR